MKTNRRRRRRTACFADTITAGIVLAPDGSVEIALMGERTSDGAFVELGTLDFGVLVGDIIDRATTTVGWSTERNDFCAGPPIAASAEDRREMRMMARAFGGAETALDEVAAGRGWTTAADP